MQHSLIGLLGALSGIFLSVSAWAGSNCPAFFDHSKDKVLTNVVQPGGSVLKAPIDITPQPPALSAFGEAALEACGAFGSAVDPSAVRKLAQIFSPDLVKELAREFPGASDSQLRAVLAQAWTNANGFEHVFCGSPRYDRIGGLHYSARYFELQRSGQLCRLENNLVNEEVLPDNVYTIGVSSSDGVIDRKKGFSIRQSAEDIFFEAARAYLRNCQAPAKERKVCINRFHKDQSFGSFFVCAPGRGIVTFYPLATGNKGGITDCL